MTVEGGPPEHDGFYPFEGEPIHDSIDTFVEMLNAEPISNKFPQVLRRAGILHEKGQRLRARGLELSSEEAEELDETLSMLMELQTVIEKYHSNYEL